MATIASAPFLTLSQSRKLSAGIVLVSILLVTALVYLPGLQGPFVFDDYNNVLNNPALLGKLSGGESLWRVMLSGQAGPLSRPLSMLSFAANNWHTGLDPYYFKVTNLAIHLLNGVIVFLICLHLLQLSRRSSQKRETRDVLIALSASAIWMLHPVQLTSVLYVVQRMTSLCGSFVLLGVLVYCRLRQNMLAGRNASLSLWIGVPTLAVLATLTKENGVLLIPFLFIVDWVLLDFQTRTAADRKSLRSFFLLFLAVPVATVAIFVVLNPEWVVKPTLTRSFTVWERLMTESRVLVLYLELLLVPAISKLALFYDDFTVSRSMLDPPSTVLATMLLCMLVGSALVLRRRFPWWSFAVLWFLVGHAMESTFIMLELVHPHRNYIAYFGPILALTVAVSRLAGRVRPGLAMVGVCVLVGLLAGTTALRANQWSDPISLAAYEVRHRPNSARAHYEYGRLAYIANQKAPSSEYYDLAYEHLWRAADLNPQGFAALIGLVLLTTDKEHHPEPRAIQALTARLRTKPLPLSEVVHVRTVVNCHGDDGCVATAETMFSIFGAALSNERQTPHVKADLLTLLGMYYANTLSDLPACVKMMREAVLLAPDDANRRLNLARALIMSGALENARAVLKEAEEIDSLGRFKFRLDTYRKDLDELSREGTQSSGSQRAG